MHRTRHTRPAASGRVRSRVSRVACVAVLLSAVTATAACGGSGSGSGSDTVAVSLITKDSINPFFVAMQEGAKKAAKDQGVDLTVGAGKEDGDEEGQITLIENAIAAGQDGILITPNGPGVNSAIKKARDAGLYVIALDTPPDPADTVDITYATDNFKAGELIGQWAAKTMKGQDVVIAMLDLFNDKIVSVDYNRDQGFLTGMGIDVKDKTKNGDEAKAGTYSGGGYTIACNEPTNGAQPDGKSAMERCLAKNPNINLVYSINEPAGIGASEALAAAGKKATIVSVDGGCLGVSKVKDGTLAATSQQYPLKMAQLGVEAIAQIAKGGAKPATSPGLDFIDTGAALVTEKPAAGVDSIGTDEASKICWGTVS
ncbi:substrate-binding domain-containing protein [Pseudofrankia sp. BMG5.37]|uniref:substrate-binding domain-containing protein n=1 Tax=Pseudofrankia sp. BMG5.37 TaxID=3050035 RepID=UPI0037C67365